MKKFIGFEWHDGELYMRFRFEYIYDIWDSTPYGDYSCYLEEKP